MLLWSLRAGEAEPGQLAFLWHLSQKLRIYLLISTLWLRISIRSDVCLLCQLRTHRVVTKRKLVWGCGYEAEVRASSWVIAKMKGCVPAGSDVGFPAECLCFSSAIVPDDWALGRTERLRDMIPHPCGGASSTESARWSQSLNEWSGVGKMISF